MRTVVYNSIWTCLRGGYNVSVSFVLLISDMMVAMILLLYAYYMPTKPLLHAYIRSRHVVGGHRPPPARDSALDCPIVGAYVPALRLSHFLTPTPPAS
jgi:hypothetical protein